MLLYKECDRGRRLLFDSSAIEQITVTEKKIDEKPTSNKIHGTRVKDTNSNSQHSNGFGYKVRLKAECYHQARLEELG